MSRGSQKILLGSHALTAETYWVRTFYEASNAAFNTGGLHVAEDGSVAVTGGENTERDYIMLFDKDGELVTNASAGTDAGTGFNYNPIIHTGETGQFLYARTVGASNYGFYLNEEQFDNTEVGKTLVRRNTSPDSNNQMNCNAVNFLSNGTAIFGGRISNEGGFLRARTMSSGTNVWDTEYTENSISGWVADIVVDSSDNVYAFGTSGGDRGFVFKVNSSGVTQFCYSFTFAGIFTIGNAFFEGTGITGNVDSSGNIYWIGANAAERIWIKLNSSGVMQSVRKTGGTIAHTPALGRHFTQNGVVYHTSPASAGYGRIIRLNTSGTNSMGYRFALYPDGGTDADGETDIGLVLERDGNVYFIGVSKYDPQSSVKKGFVAKLPNDESLTGTFSNGTNTVEISLETQSTTNVTSDWTSGGNTIDTTDYTTGSVGNFSGGSSITMTTTPAITYPTKVDIE